MLEDFLRKIDQLQGELAPFRPFSAERISLIKDYYRIGLTYASNALEGNTLTESETKVVLEDGLTTIKNFKSISCSGPPTCMPNSNPSTLLWTATVGSAASC